MTTSRINDTQGGDPPPAARQQDSSKYRSQQHLNFRPSASRWLQLAGIFTLPVICPWSAWNEGMMEKLCRSVHPSVGNVICLLMDFE